MALTELTQNLNAIQSLPDQPTLTADELKAEFDKSANLIKEYLNDTLLSELNTLLTNLQNKDITLESAINKVKTTVTEATTNITALQKSVSTNTSNISTLKTDVSNLKTSMNTANTNISSMQTTLKGLKSGATTKISKGTSVPSSLADGEVYLQYF